MNSWKKKGIFPERTILEIEKTLANRGYGDNTENNTSPGFTSSEILKRIEEDRERVNIVICYTFISHKTLFNLSFFSINAQERKCG